MTSGAHPAENSRSAPHFASTVRWKEPRSATPRVGPAGVRGATPRGVGTWGVGRSAVMRARFAWEQCY